MHLERFTRTMEFVAMSGGAASVGDISASTGFPKPSVYRMVKDLVAAGLLESSEKGLYSIGRRFHGIARMDRSDADIGQLAEPLLQSTADEFGVACFLSRLKGDGVEITQVVVPKDEKVSFLHPGLGLRPMHACSCAKVIAAYASPEFQDDLLKSRLRPYTEHTRIEGASLRKEFQTIRDRGYGECVQELELGICSVAAPVHLSDLGVGLSVGATGSLRVFTDSFRPRIGQALVQVAKNLAARLEPSASRREVRRVS